MHADISSLLTRGPRCRMVRRRDALVHAAEKPAQQERHAGHGSPLVNSAARDARLPGIACTRGAAQRHGTIENATWLTALAGVVVPVLVR